MKDNFDHRPGASGRRWEARFSAARQRRGQTEPSKFESSIAKGNAGEEALGRELTALAQEMELGVLHDLTLPGKRANIDHLLIGPTGVTVIDAKAWSGPVWISDTTIGQGRRSRSSHLQGVGEQVARVKEALDQAGVGDVEVEGLLCLVNGNQQGKPTVGLVQCAGVGVGDIPTVRSYVSRGGAVDLGELARINSALQQAFVVHGGAYLPQRSAYQPAAHQAAAAEVSFEAHVQRLNLDFARDQTLRSKRRIARRRRLAASIAICAAASGSVLVYRPPDPPTTRPLMSLADLQLLRPVIRAAVEHRAGGSVRGPAVVVEPATISLRYRRSRRCRVRVSVDRHSHAWSLSSRACARR